MQEDMVELRNDFTKLKLEIEAIKLRQESTERMVKELQSEAVQRDEDLRKSTKHLSKVTFRSLKIKMFLLLLITGNGKRNKFEFLD